MFLFFLNYEFNKNKKIVMSLALLPKDAFAQIETEEPLSNFWEKKKLKPRLEVS